MKPIGVVVNHSESPFFPHINHYYTFDEFEFLAIAAARYETEFGTNEPDNPPITNVTLTMDNHHEATINFGLSYDGYWGIQDFIRYNLSIGRPGLSPLEELQFVTH
jgi:hypothetical protein